MNSLKYTVGTLFTLLSTSVSYAQIDSVQQSILHDSIISNFEQRNQCVFDLDLECIMSYAPKELRPDLSMEQKIELLRPTVLSKNSNVRLVNSEVIDISPVRVIGEKYFVFLTYENTYESRAGVIKYKDEETLKKAILLLMMIFPNKDISYDRSREVFVMEDSTEELCISYDQGDSWRFVSGDRELLKAVNLEFPDELWEYRN